MKRTLVVSAFPGTGKSYFTKTEQVLKVSDSDSMNFSWVKGKEGEERHPDFPNNYIEHIKSLVGKMDIIFVSSHDTVREAMAAAGIEYVVVRPEIELKDEYIKRYIERGNNEKFVQLMDSKWDDFVNGLANDTGASSIIVFEKGDTMYSVKNTMGSWLR